MLISSRSIASMLAAAAVALVAGADATSQTSVDLCGDLSNSYGPYDYRKDRGETLRLVESAHFHPLVEALISGKVPGSPVGPEIDYVLRAYPNHHRALVAAIRLGDKFKTTQPPGMRYTTECWLMRAVRFRPDDAVARTLMAQWLARRDRLPEALAQLKHAESLAGDNAFAHYNIGLVYLEASQYDLALSRAHKALALGFSRTELKDQLAAAGKWKEPEGEAAPDAVSPATSAADASPATIKR